jgi:Kdo2-lipid IVA lauroyltransferase/acyltransferase
MPNEQNKERSRVKDYAVYLVVRCIVCVIQTLPYTTACQLAAGLAWLAERIDKRHRQVAYENLGRAFPGAFDHEQRKEQVRAIYRHFCTVLIEIIHLPRLLHPTTWRRHLCLHNSKRLVNLLVSGRPVMLVTGHFGNWEMGGYVLGMLGFKTYAIARPLDNPFLDDLFRNHRERTGQGILAKKGDYDRLQEILASNGVVATLADQDAGQRGLFVDYFGQPASTHKAVALLALEYNVPMAVIGVRKVGNPIRYENICEDVILPDEYAGSADAVKKITQRFTSALERIVRTAPEQYFWLHRRWKHQPKAARRTAA